MKAYVESYGCAANKAYGISLEGALENRGIELSDSLDAAELIVVNTCTVKGRTEARMLERIRALSGVGKKVIVTGCMATAQRGLAASLVGAENVVPLESLLTPQECKAEDDWSRIVPPLPSRPLGRTAVVPIARGCLGSCSYCIVRRAVGPLRSHSIAALVTHIEEMVRGGAAEAYLTSQDLAAFGTDNGETLVELLEAISSIPGDFRVRLGMMTPNGAAPIIDEILRLFERDRKFYRFLHLPLQSGDDDILKVMGRGYGRADFLSIVERARARVSSLTVTTDIIVGFPFEDEPAFQNTLTAIRSSLPNKVNISKFSPRPHTIASLLPQVDRATIESRSRKAHETCKEVTKKANEELVGEELEVIPHRSSEGSYSGRAFNFLPVKILTTKQLELYRSVTAKVERATASGLVTRI